MIPMLHCSYLFRTPTYAFAALNDWKKAVRIQREGPTILPPPINKWQWEPNIDDVRDYFRAMQYAIDPTRSSKGQKYWPGPWSVDFEATLDGKPVCMAIWSCHEPMLHRGLCIPLLKQGGAPYWDDRQQAQQVLGWITEFLTNPKLGKIGHNIVGYDFGYPPWNMSGLVKKAWGIDVQGIVLDTLVAHHSTFVELKHGLAFCASIATDLGPYKVEVHEQAKDPDEITEEDVPTASWARVLEIPDEQLRTYCLKDAWATVIVAKGLVEEMKP